MNPLIFVGSVGTPGEQITLPELGGDTMVESVMTNIPKIISGVITPLGTEIVID